jgi:hypothetical protein
VAQGL